VNNEGGKSLFKLLKDTEQIITQTYDAKY